MHLDELTGTRPTVYTLGHSHHSFTQFVGLLQQHQIAVVVDVRSKPWVTRAKHFNREPLDSALRREQIEYLWLGEHLGQRPHGDHYYDKDGYALYEPISQATWFMKAIGRVEYEAERRRLALICLEEEPERCHRYHLLGRVLRERHSDVVHIRRSGHIETQSEVAQRLGEGQLSLIDESTQAWRSPAPMKQMDHPPSGGLSTE